ncbi:hypothetical protein BV22DRAFT_355506 [Leucogyrophana mollusca]|uniref:Uncharacterized protein n=1 Tax=Leucogyrophana mollusca TaxID=85980 RepID=A0ACB8BML9_9AGAM|nr:hypothetical protein BV22DRAFT_355506 [Leucogyrophana mollusca]
MIRVHQKRAGRHEGVRPAKPVEGDITCGTRASARVATPTIVIVVSFVFTFIWPVRTSLTSKVSVERGLDDFRVVLAHFFLFPKTTKQYKVSFDSWDMNNQSWFYQRSES